MFTELKTHHRNGRLEKLEIYRNGNIEAVKWWYSNGQLQTCEFFCHGRLNGISKWWYSTGMICERTFYQSGMLIDSHFSRKKEYAFRKLKRRCIGKSSSLSNAFLISDLLRLTGN